jgi:hypothetical protein
MAGHCVQSDIPPGVLFKLSIQTNDEIKILGIPFKTQPLALLVKQYAV